MHRQFLIFFAFFSIFFASFSCELDSSLHLEIEEEITSQHPAKESVPSAKQPLTAIPLNDSNFEQTFQDSNDEYLLVISAVSCGACNRFSKELEKFVLAGTANVKVAKIDIPDSPATTARLWVLKIPSLFHYVNGSFYVLENHFNAANLTSYFENKEWLKMEPRSDYISPFSFTGKSVAAFVTIAKTAVVFLEEMKQKYSPLVVYGILAVIPIILLIFILLITKKSSPTTKEKHRMQKQSEDLKMADFQKKIQ